MNSSRWSKSILVTLVVVATTLAAMATPLKSPRRVVGEQTVDLSPLFHWWTNHTGDRPLQAWAHLTGKVIATNSYGWVVDAHVESSKRATGEAGTEQADPGGYKKILLRHPPLQDRAAFDQLAAQLKTLTKQREQAVNAQDQAKRSLHSGGGNSRRFEAKARGWKHQEMLAEQQNAAATQKQLDKQIQDVKTKLAAWPSTDHYEVDCFALDTGGAMNQVPLYDHGQSWQ